MESFNLIIAIVLAILILLIGVDIFWIVDKLRKRKSSKSSEPEEASTEKSLLPLTKQSKIILLKIGFNILGLSLIIAALILSYTRIEPKIINSTPKTEGVWESYSKPIEVFFNMPVDASRLYVNMNPELKGKWTFIPYLGISRFTTYGYFIPEETLYPDQRIVVYITGIGRVGYKSESHEYGFVFDSVKLPEIKSTTPTNNLTEVDNSSKIILNLSKDNSGNVGWSFKSSPEVEFDIDYTSSRQITLTPKIPLDLSTEYVVQTYSQAKLINLKTKEILDTDNPILIHELKFTTKREPLLRSYLPRGNSVQVDTPIKLKFMTEMDENSVISNFMTEPNIAGDFEWEDPKTLVFKASTPLEKESTYKVIIKKGIKNTAGLISENDINFEFKTIGFIRMQSNSPQNGETKVHEGIDIKVTFNQDVDHGSAESHFSMSPGVQGTFSWDSNTLIFNPTNSLNFNTNYSVTLSPGIISTKGFNNNEPLVFSFRTRTNEIVISMPLYYQPQYPVSFSCNIYAAKMALAWKGYSTTIPGLIEEIGYDTTQDSNGKWLGDPNVNYVGNSDGTWGYGVHWGPVQKMFSNRGITTQIKTGWNINDLARSIDNGQPVVIWRYNGTSQDRNLEWGTSGIYAINGQHGGVISGYRGTPENPSAFYINDPWFGLIWMDINTFDYYWSRLGRSGLVVF